MLTEVESSMCSEELCEVDLEGPGELDCSQREQQSVPQPLYVPSKLVQHFKNWEIWVC